MADAQMSQLQQLLDTHSGVTEGLNDRPFPEGGVFLEAEVDGLAGRVLTYPHLRRPEVLLAATVGVGEHPPIGVAPGCDRRILGCGLADGQQLGQAGVVVTTRL